MVLSLGWQPLTRVSNLLRRRGQADLSRLLIHATATFEWSDEAYPIDGSAEIALVSAVVSAPLDDFDKLHALGHEDIDQILEAMRAVWPFNETDREHIHHLSFKLDAQSLDDDLLTIFRDPVGWTDIGNALNVIRAKLDVASDVNAYAEVGLLCRRVLVQMGQTIFDPEKHPPLGADDAEVSLDDVKRIVARYLEVEMAGPSRQTVRQCVRSAVDLASQLVHSSNSTYRDATLCAQATFNIIGLFYILSANQINTDDHEFG